MINESRRSIGMMALAVRSNPGTLFLHMVILFTNCAFAQEPQPKLELSEEKIEILVIPGAMESERSVFVRNIGDAPLEILKIEVSCGCIFEDLLDEIIQPGEQTTLTIKILNSDLTAGTKFVRLFTNDPSQEIFLITIASRIPKAVEYSPKKLTISRETATIKFELHLYRFSTEPVSKVSKISKISTSNPQIEIKKLGVIEEEWGIRHQYSLSIQGFAQLKRREFVHIRTDDVEVPVIEIPVEISKR